MDNVRVIEVKENVFASNIRNADELRARMKEQGTLLVNLMSSPGAGKTTLLSQTIRPWMPRPSACTGPRRSRSTPAACVTWMRV